MGGQTETAKVRVAIVRPPGDSFRLAVSRHADRDRIDPHKARAQHEIYCATLSGLGVKVITLAPDERYPDGCFTQDPALVLKGQALIGRTGVGSRAAEAESLAAALVPFVDALEHLLPPATLEGGDVLLIGKRILVGRSIRTNKAGIEAVTRFAGALGYRVTAVPVPAGVLHLSTAVTAPSDGLVIGLDEVLENEAFAGMEKIPVEEALLAACNVLTIDDQIIASGDYPVHDKLANEGFKVHRLDLSEFVRADAGPTCLSQLIR